MPIDDPDVMPPDGGHLTDAELLLIQRWIAQGAPREGGAAVVPAPVSVVPRHAPTTMEVLAETLPSLPERVVSDLRARHIRFDFLDPDKKTVALDATYIDGELNGKSWQPIIDLGPHLVRLDVGKLAIAGLLSPGWKNLEMLNAERSTITERDLSVLKHYPKLRVLNLSHTTISDQVVEVLRAHTHLQRIYLFNTRITENGLSRLRTALPHTEVVSAVRLP